MGSEMTEQRTAGGAVDEQVRGWRRTGLVCLALAGCAAVVTFGESGSNGKLQSAHRTRSFVELSQLRADEDSSWRYNGVVGAFGAKPLMQRLAATLEAEFQGGSSAPVELEQAAAAPQAAKTSCDAACEQKKKMIATKMKALRDQINHDFSSMIDFGRKAGYLPPPQSIRAQVMSGTLMGGDGKTGADAVAPPPFKASVASALKGDLPDVKGGASSSKDATASPSTGSSSASQGKTSLAANASPAPAAAPAPVAPPAPAPSIAAPSDSLSSTNTDDSSSADDSSTSKAKSGGSAAWAKAFSFIKHTDNPVVGDKSGKSGKRTAKSSSHGDLLKAAASSDKFLRDFENPGQSLASAPSPSHSSGSSSTASSSDTDNSLHFLDKGSDPLKFAAGGDKFLKGFLG